MPHHDHDDAHAPEAIHGATPRLRVSVPQRTPRGDIDAAPLDLVTSEDAFGALFGLSVHDEIGGATVGDDGPAPVVYSLSGLGIGHRVGLVSELRDAYAILRAREVHGLLDTAAAEWTAFVELSRSVAVAHLDTCAKVQAAADETARTARHLRQLINSGTLADIVRIAINQCATDASNAAPSPDVAVSDAATAAAHKAIAEAQAAEANGPETQASPVAPAAPVPPVADTLAPPPPVADAAPAAAPAPTNSTPSNPAPIAPLADVPTVTPE